MTVDGRQSASAGMRLDELAAELVSLGAAEAMNLDGGGSTTLWAGGRVRNSPSDGWERPVSDAILIFSTPDAPALRALLDRLAADPDQVAGATATRLGALIEAKNWPAFDESIRAAGPGEISASAARLLREAAAAVSRLRTEP